MNLIQKRKNFNFSSKIVSFKIYKNKNLKNRKVIGINSFLRDKKENLLNINGNIDLCFNKNKTNGFILFNKQNIKRMFFISFFLLKQNLFLKLGRKKQYFYSILNLIYVLKNTINDLNKDEIFLFSSLENKKNIYLFTAKQFQTILFVPESVCYAIQKQNFVVNLIWSKYFKLFFSIYLQLYFIFIISNVQKTLKNLNFLFFPLVTNLENGLINEYLSKQTSEKITLKHIFRRKELLALFLGRTTTWNLFKNNSTWTFFIFERLLLNPEVTFWKLGSLRKKSKFEEKISLNLIYCILRLEEKFKTLKESDSKMKQTILAFRNLLLKKKYNKLLFNKKSKYFLSDLKFLKAFKKQTKKTSFSSFFKKNIFITSNIHKIKQNLKKKRSQFDKVGLWKEKKILENNSLISLKNFPQVFSLILGTPTSLVFINALTLTKFGFPRKVTGARRFLTRIERDLIQRYKYIAVYIQDFVRICFFSFFLKKPTFLANFIGFQIAKLPRNRKETSLIRFIIKIIKIFAAQRREITAIKIEFKGRVNRWRRTKIIKGTRGVISYVNLDSRIEFGSGKTITRKGTLGIRLWFAYKLTFVPVFRQILLSYILYSQILKSKKIDLFLKNFQSRLN